MWKPQYGTRARQMIVAQPAEERQLKYAIEREDRAAIIRVLHHSGNVLFNQGRLTILRRAFNRLPNTLYQEDATLCLLGARLAQTEHHDHRVAELLALWHPHSQDPTWPFTGEFQALSARLAMNQNQPQHARSLAETALIILDHASCQSRLIATSVIAELQYNAGHLPEALSLMQQIERLATQHRFSHQILWAQIQQIEIYLQTGDLVKTGELQQKAFDLASFYQLYELPIFELLTRLRMLYLFESGQIEEAESQARHYLSHSMNTVPHPLIDTSLAMLALSQQQHSKARTYLEHLTIPPSHVPTNWQAYIDNVRVLYWCETENRPAIHHWLMATATPTNASNHLHQLQWRTLARAHLLLGHYQQSLNIVDHLEEAARRYSLAFEAYRNQCLKVSCYAEAKQTSATLKALMSACQSAFKLGIHGQFYFCSKYSLTLLPRLLNEKNLSNSQKAFIQTLIEHLRAQRMLSATLPQLRRMNTEEQTRLLGTPLTPREWQILTAIYSGNKNEAIALQLNIAPTTLKTHIRNIYKKLNVTNRKQAISLFDNSLRESKCLHL